MDVVGIDRAQLRCAATLRTSSGTHQDQALPHTPAGCTQMGTWRHQHGVAQVHLGLEATNSFWEALAAWGHAQGHSVRGGTPARSNGHARATMPRTTTDTLDRAVSTDVCAQHQPAAWAPLHDAHRQLRALLWQRDAVLQTVWHQKNRVRDTTDALVRPSRAVVLKAVATHLQAGERPSTAQLTVQDDLAADLAVLTSVVGSGTVTAATVLAELPDRAAEDSAQAAAAATGVTPSHVPSGTSVRRRPRMAKQGTASLRAARSWPAITAMNRCPGFTAVADALAQRGTAKKVGIGAVMRTLLHGMDGVVKHRTPDDPTQAFGQSAPST